MISGDCSHEIERCLLPRRKAMTNLDSILKSRENNLLTKVCLVKAMVFPVVMYGCESSKIKKAQHRRTDGFDFWCWRRFLKVSWTARRSNQSVLKKISSEYSLKGLMLKLKLQFLMWRIDSLKKTLILGKIEDGRKEGVIEDETVGWHHQLNEHEFGQTPGDSEEQGNLGYCSLSTAAGHSWVTEQQKG